MIVLTEQRANEWIYLTALSHALKSQYSTIQIRLSCWRDFLTNRLRIEWLLARPGAAPVGGWLLGLPV
jgi:hypothetical protein